MTRVIIIVFSCLAIISGVKLAKGQDREHDHAQHHNFYKEWKQPRNPTQSCCNVREVNTYGNISGDCYPTRAELRPSAKPHLKDKLVWWAWRKYGRAEDGKPFIPHWIEINDLDIVHEKNPDQTGTDAHICQPDNFTDDRVYCFKGPVGAY